MCLKSFWEPEKVKMNLLRWKMSTGGSRARDRRLYASTWGGGEGEGEEGGGEREGQGREGEGEGERKGERERERRGRGERERGGKTKGSGGRKGGVREW